MSTSEDKYKSKYVKKYYKKRFKELNLLQEEATHQESKYENINKNFSKRKTSKEETFNIAYCSDGNSSSISEYNNSSPKIGNKKTSITYSSDSADYGKSTAVPLAVRPAIESTVADMPLS